MRLLPEEATEYNARFRNSPVPPATAAPPPVQQKCVPESRCPWWPYSSSRDFETNATLIIVLLFSALISAFAFSAAARCILRSRRRRRPARDSDNDDKAAVEAKEAGDDEDGDAVPTVIFSAAAAEEGGTVAEECTICLGEFVDGERVRVLENCKHCFHIHCIRQWLNNHSSCPTCRATYN